MREKMKDDYKIAFIRGATTSSGNSVEEVKKFADGRIFTGTQAKELGLIDEVGDEFVAREIAAKMVDIDPKIQPLTFGKKKKKILGLIPGSKVFEKVINSIFFEIDSSNKILWLYKP